MGTNIPLRSRAYPFTNGYMTTTNTETRWSDGEFFIRFIHMGCGWRFWAAKTSTAEDVEAGLSASGYLSMDAARRAVAKAQKAVSL